MSRTSGVFPLPNGVVMQFALVSTPVEEYFPGLGTVTLHPMDVLVCDHKPASLPKDIIENLFRWMVFLFQSVKYPWLPEVFRWSTHVRIFVGRGRYGLDPDKLWVYDFTTPKAGFREYEPWMVHPNYATVVCSTEIRDASYPKWKVCYENFLWICAKYHGSSYNYGELLAIATGIKRLTFGKKQKVCSTGSRMVLENAVGHAFDQEPSIYPKRLFGTPPAWFIAKALRPSCYTSGNPGLVKPPEFLITIKNGEN